MIEKALRSLSLNLYDASDIIHVQSILLYNECVLFGLSFYLNFPNEKLQFKWKTSSNWMHIVNNQIDPERHKFIKTKII